MYGYALVQYQSQNIIGVYLRSVSGQRDYISKGADK